MEPVSPLTEPPALVIFDCDGVLVDSERLAVDLDVKICSRFGYEITHQDVIDRYLGRSAGLVWLDLERFLGRELTAAERAANSREFTELYDTDLTAVPGVAEALDQIPYAKCVASSSSPDPLRWKLDHCGVIDHFGEHIFSGHQVRNGKPAPDLFLFAADQVGVAPERCVVVEDSIYGVQAARSAGMQVFAYVAGMIPEDALAGPGTTLFHAMAQLPALLGAN